MHGLELPRCHKYNEWHTIFDETTTRPSIGLRMPYCDKRNQRMDGTWCDEKRQPYCVLRKNYDVFQNILVRSCARIHSFYRYSCFCSSAFISQHNITSLPTEERIVSFQLLGAQQGLTMVVSYTNAALKWPKMTQEGQSFPDKRETGTTQPPKKLHILNMYTYI